jgi:hypothetical protein
MRKKSSTLSGPVLLEQILKAKQSAQPNDMEENSKLWGSTRRLNVKNEKIMNPPEIKLDTSAINSSLVERRSRKGVGR